MNTNKKILVPTDFTTVSETAINHALKVGKAIGAEIYVLHVIAKKIGSADAEIKLRALKEQVKEENGVDIHTQFRIGSIYEDVDAYSVEIGANLIIMGSHGARGYQFLTGTRALKMVTESKIPFIIVQDKKIDDNGYDSIVVPLDLHKDTKQKLKVAANMAMYFNSQVHLVSPNEKDEYLKNQVIRNLKYGVKYFKEKNVVCTTKILNSKSSGFVKDILEYAEEVNADLISIMNFSEDSLMSFFGGTYEHQIITNKLGIAVLCLNPVDRYIADQSIFT